jgi:hypothetical protein
MTRYLDMPPAQRELADRLYESIWRGPCGHHSPQMWVDDDLTIHCAAVLWETHVPSDEHLIGTCGGPGSACTIAKCGRLYTGADLPA